MRKGLVLEFWDRSEYLGINNKKYRDYVNKILNEKLQEDASYGDVTTNSLINKNKNAKAVIIAIGPLGEIEKTTLTVKAPYWPMKPPRRLSLTPGIGFTYLIYREDPL